MHSLRSYLFKFQPQQSLRLIKCWLIELANGVKYIYIYIYIIYSCVLVIYIKGFYIIIFINFT